MVMFGSKRRRLNALVAANVRRRAQEEEEQQKQLALKVAFEENRDTYKAAWEAENPLRKITVRYGYEPPLTFLAHSWGTRGGYQPSRLGSGPLVIYKHTWDGYASHPQHFEQIEVARLDPSFVRAVHFEDCLITSDHERPEATATT